MFRPLGQNQAEFAQPAVLCFWRPCKFKQSEIRVAYLNALESSKAFGTFCISVHVGLSHKLTLFLFCLMLARGSGFLMDNIQQIADAVQKGL